MLALSLVWEKAARLLKNPAVLTVAGVPGSVRVPGRGGEGGGVEARKSTRADEEAGLR